jgi:hypothetical protein
VLLKQPEARIAMTHGATKPKDEIDVTGRLFGYQTNTTVAILERNATISFMTSRKNANYIYFVSYNK